MRYHDTIRLTAIEDFIDAFGQLKPDPVIHVLRTDIRNLFGSDRHELSDSGNILEQLLASSLAGVVTNG